MKETNAAEIKVLGLNEKQLVELSGQRLLSLDLAEMKAAQDHFEKQGRNPTDIELETLAQTWSEHCKHKVFNCTIEYEDENGFEKIDGLFGSFIAKATDTIKKKKSSFLVSVFSDNAGIISFNEKFDVAVKVETHNHPSALEPYGGASTGIGGVIRDVLGAGLGAKPVANTDVFCFAEPWTEKGSVPAGVLHPKRVFKGVRAGVRDYGNRMGIPTVNGAILFDKRYLGNPLVFCGTVGVLPKGMHEKKVSPGELIVVIGGRTGRDGLHGATFSSVGLEETSPASAVQIGNAIEEKKMLDVILQARDRKLYNCITDCGAGGFSSAVGEMAKSIGAIVFLEKAPLKYKGLSPWEIWLSESQERMVLAVPKNKWNELREMCELEEVEATVIGEFTGDKKLKVLFNGNTVLELGMEFLHYGLPKQKRKAKWVKPDYGELTIEYPRGLGKALHQLLAMPNIASKETTIRQYDHEVQGGAILKPMVGAEEDSPGDAAVIRPFFDSWNGIAISNGINPLYSDIDPYWMAASAIDEAIRNCIAVGADPARIALLDNFSWGNPDKQIKLAEIVRACKACYDASTKFEAPFVSGKDSLYNEFNAGSKHISVPGTLLVSALGVMEDVRKRVSMDFKEEGNPIYLLGTTFNELGGSHYAKLHGQIGNDVPKVNAVNAKRMYEALFAAMSVGSKNSQRIVRSCHDCSEGGLGVTAAEMAFGGMLGAEIELSRVLLGEKMYRNDFILFSESNSRLIVEVAKPKEKEFEKIMKEHPVSKIGEVTSSSELVVKGLEGKPMLQEKLVKLKDSWKKTLKW